MIRSIFKLIAFLCFYLLDLSLFSISQLWPFSYSLAFTWATIAAPTENFTFSCIGFFFYGMLFHIIFHSFWYPLVITISIFTFTAWLKNHTHAPQVVAGTSFFLAALVHLLATTSPLSALAQAPWYTSINFLGTLGLFLISLKWLPTAQQGNRFQP